MYNCNARWYDPELMRFISRDPVRGNVFESMTLHRYLYCVNDPVNRFDPDGKWGLFAARLVVGGLISGISNAMSAEDGERGYAFAAGFAIGAISAISGDAVISAILSVVGANFNASLMSQFSYDSENQKFGRMLGTNMGLMAGILPLVKGSGWTGLVATGTASISGNFLGDIIGGIIEGGEKIINKWQDNY